MADTDNIPSDIEQAATRFAGKYLAHDISCERLYRDAAALVMAERERCALIAEGKARDASRDRDTYIMTGVAGLGRVIATAIRQPRKVN